MKIGIIGAGLIGKCLAEKLSAKGHTIKISNSRGPRTIEFANATTIKATTLRDTVVEADMVILTIPFGKTAELPKDLFDHLDKNIPIIETMNYFPQRDGLIEEIENGKTHSVWVQEQIGRSVVKAFSNIVAHSFIRKGQDKNTTGRIALAISGDNPEWVALTIKIVDETGFDGYDAGSIAESWRQQPVNPAYCADLTVDQLKLALLMADKEKAIITRDISTEKIAEFGEEYFKILITGNYPENFNDKVVSMYRSLNGIDVQTGTINNH